MRGVIAIVLLSGCNLYVASSDGVDGGEAIDAGPPSVDALPPIDAPPLPPTFTFAQCAGGVLYRSAPGPSAAVPDDVVATGTSFAPCASRCLAGDAAETYQCLGDASCADAAAWLCEHDAGCPATDATCSDGDSAACSAPMGCGMEVPTEACACDGGTFACESVCADGICTAIETLEALVGRWVGTVTPLSFTYPTYPIELRFFADGHYESHGTGGGEPAFYYGSDGAGPDRKLNLLVPTAAGATARIALVWGDGSGSINDALLTGLHVRGDTLDFTFWDSWGSCSREFDIVLTRAP